MNTLAAKIAKASLKVGALATDKRNTQQGYDYISADKILERAGDALVEAGVVVLPSITQEFTERTTTDKGGSRYDSIIHFAMIVTDGESQLEFPWCGRGSDYAVPDKAFYKAITSGHKYFLMKLLNIGVGNEDGEHENEPDSKPQNIAREATQASTRASKASSNTTPQHRTQNATTREIEAKNEVNFGMGSKPSDEEHDIITQWASTKDAIMWAIMAGSCQNEFEANNSFKKSVTKFGGKITPENSLAVRLDFLRHQREKLTVPA